MPPSSFFLIPRPILVLLIIRKNDPPGAWLFLGLSDDQIQHDIHGSSEMALSPVRFLSAILPSSTAQLQHTHPRSSIHPSHQIRIRKLLLVTRIAVGSVSTSL